MEKYVFGDKSADIVLIQPVDEHELASMEIEVRFIADNGSKPFQLIAVMISDWNHELSPWEAPAVFGKEGFGKGAPDTLGRLLKLCNDKSKVYYIGGYSLAGLFALWAVHQTDLFRGVAAASPSMWFPGFIDYMKEHRIRCDHVYLSLGDKEEKARNSVMATVGDRIRETYALLQDRNVSSVLEWNEGNHFKEADLRMAKAFTWLLSNC